MSPRADPGFCNLECWCHVPTRGVNKPPCYLCVINCCSLSTKQDVAPSAPELSPEEEMAPTTFPDHSVSVEALSAIGASSSRTSWYGWRGTVVRSASLESGRTSENTWGEIFVRLPPDQTNEPSGEIIDTSLEVGSQESRNEVTVDERPDQHVTTVEVPDQHITTTEVNTDSNNERDADLAKLIRSIAVDDTDEEEGDVRGRSNRAGLRSPNDRNKTRRRRDKYQSFHNLDVRHLCIPRVSISGHQSASTNSVQNETEFQKLHKIQRRDTSLDAARRYLQSDENLHRAWMREVAVRRRNYPRRSHRSTRRCDEGSHRPLFAYDEAWKQYQKHQQKQSSKETGMDT